MARAIPQSRASLSEEPMWRSEGSLWYQLPPSTSLTQFSPSGFDAVHTRLTDHELPRSLLRSSNLTTGDLDPTITPDLTGRLDIQTLVFLLL